MNRTNQTKKLYDRITLLSDGETWLFQIPENHRTNKLLIRSVGSPMDFRVEGLPGTTERQHGRYWETKGPQESLWWVFLGVPAGWSPLVEECYVRGKVCVVTFRKDSLTVK